MVDRQRLIWAAATLGIALGVFLLLTVLSDDPGSEPEDALFTDLTEEEPEDALEVGPVPVAAPTVPDEPEPLRATATDVREPLEASEIGTDAPPVPDGDSRDRDPPAEGPPTQLIPGTGGRDVEPREPFIKDFGMVWVEEGKAILGTKKERILSQAKRRKFDGPVNLVTEWPRHKRPVTAFSMDKYEVTNAQFRRFLERDALVEYTSQLSDYRDGDDVLPLIRVAQFLVTRRIPTGEAWLEPDGPGWLTITRQLYETNRKTLWEVYPGLVFRDDQEVVDEERTWEAFLGKEIRSGIELRFYDVPPPSPWPTMTFAPGMAAHPVRGISHEDATDFAYWAGKHLPLELEWEYAARGPGGLGFPWDDDGSGFDDIVNGGQPFEEDVTPTTMPVNTRATGASWVGCYHMVGNVSEFTGSLLTEYSSDVAWEPIPDPSVHEWAQTIGWGTDPVRRGGSVADVDQISLRPAFRGYTRPPLDEIQHERRKEELPPPLFELRPKRSHRLEWTGFRCARYVEPGRSRLVGLTRAVTRETFIGSSFFDFENFAAAEQNTWVEPDDRPSDGTYVLDRTRSLVVVPIETVSFVKGKDNPAFTRDLIEVDDLLAFAQGDVTIVLGLIQTDVPAKNVYFGNNRDPADRPARFAQTELPPGTYFLVVRHGYLALTSLDAKTTWWLQKNPKQAGNLFVVKSRTRENPFRRAAFRFDERDDRIEFELFEELQRSGGEGGADPDEKLSFVLRVRFHLETPKDVLRGADEWARHPDE